MRAWSKKFRVKINHIIGWLKQHPNALVWMALTGVGIYMQWIIIGLIYSSTEVFSMEAIREILGIGVEVIAGLYGLTLTGYIFFLDRLQQKAEDDELLEDIIVLLKKRYHNMVLFLSGICFVVILLAFSFMIYNTECGILSDKIYYFWGYETLLLLFVTLLFNIYFVIIVVDPDKIPRTSLQYKQKLSSSDSELGSLQEFLQDYEDIEELLRTKSEGLAISHIGTNPWRAVRHLNGRELVEIYKIISAPLLKKMTKLGQYYSYMIFSQEMTVTKEMCDMAKEVKIELEEL